jgi:hypothetical protein
LLQLSELPGQIGSHVTHLNVSGNRLHRLPDELLKHSTKLSLLDLSGNPFADLPSDLFESNPALETLIWERDDCRLAAGETRIFPNLKNIRNFSYSAKDQEGTMTCQNWSFPERVFERLQNLKISNTILDWSSSSEFFHIKNIS